MSNYPEVDFLYLSEEDMIKAGVMDMDKCVDTMEEVLRLLAKGDFMMGGNNHFSHGTKLSFPKTSEFPNMPTDNGEDRRFMAMPAYLGAPFDRAGVKWYGSNMENKKKGLPRSILMFTLTDKETGAPLAFLSANLLSAYRTGGIPGVGSRYLARKNSEIVGIYGPGVMGKTSLDAFMSTCPNLKKLKIKGRSQHGIDTFIEYAKEKYPKLTEIEVVDSAEALVRDCDVVSFTETSGHDASLYPMVKGEWIKPGALIVCPGSAQFEDDFLANNARMVVDALGLYEAWVEENPYPTYGKITMLGVKFMDMVHEGKIKLSDICDLGQMLLGNTPGRKSDDEIFIYSVGGMPVEDVAWASVCYDKAVEMGLGTGLKLWDKPFMA